jgi:hypothetical protein
LYRSQQIIEYPWEALLGSSSAWEGIGGQMSRPQFQYLNAGELAAEVGGDPWQMNDEVQTGDPASISGLADAFHQAGAHLKDADDQFAAAKKQFEDSYNRNNGAQHPINDGQEVQKVSAALAGHPEELSKIAVDLEQLAAALATAQRESAMVIDALDEHLHAVDNDIAAQGESPWLIPQLGHEAVDVTKAALDHIENIRGAYADQLHGAETAMMASGYVPDALDADDGTPGDAPKDAAAQYDRSGQRAKDQATVDNAKRLHPNGLGWELDQTAAARRLADYTSVTDPANGVAKYGDEHAKDEAGRLAGERLDDFNVANSVGPVAKDPVLGGDMRDRAKNRLLLQRQLEDAQLPWSQIPMHADDATKMMDGLEVQDRQAALTRLQEQLHANGMSTEGAATMANGIAHGVIPQEYLNMAKTESKSMDVTARAAEGFTKALSPGNVMGMTLSEADLQSLEKIGKNMGHGASALEVGIAIYEATSGQKTAVQAGMGVAGSLAGAWALGEPGAAAGAAIGGPVGAFVVGAPAALVGGMLGEAGADRIYQYFTGGE